jgi:hypothetical protein
VAKQKCGTCRFYQEAGLAGSGWCHHPLRKVSSDVMIMVRRNELACRDEWSESLWAPQQGSEVTEKSFLRPSHLGPTAPASLENMRSLLRTNTTVSSSSLEGEDVLLSEGRIISETHESPVRLERPSAGFDPRTAVFKAREAYRERSRAREAAARHFAGAEAASTARYDAEKLPPAREIVAEQIPTDVEDASEPSEPRPVPRRSTVADTPRMPNGIPPRAAERTIDQAPETREEEGAGLSPATETEISLAGILTGAMPKPSAPATRIIPEQTVTLSRLREIDEEDLPDWFRTDLPRICRTCRDYRPSADGGRGWCANSWAFTHRRLVREEDPAPCDSSIGDWWAPVDDVWLVAADVSSHGRATPLLDRLTAQERSQRRRS